MNQSTSELINARQGIPLEGTQVKLGKDGEEMIEDVRLYILKLSPSIVGGEDINLDWDAVFTRLELAHK